MTQFLNTTEDLWDKGPIRKLYYKQKYNVYFDEYVKSGESSENAKALAHLKVIRLLGELFEVAPNDLYEKIRPVELLMLISVNKEELTDPYKIEFTEGKGYVNGYIEKNKIELLFASKLEYDEYEFLHNDVTIDHENQKVTIKTIL